MNILVINGPNLNMLGNREPEIYGYETLEEMMLWLQASTQGLDHQFKFYQSNHEGAIIDTIQDECDWYDGMIINPGALAHYSYSIRDAIASIKTPTVEVHLTDILSREPFRNKSVISDVCIKMICGQGKKGYLDALKLLQSD